MFKPTLNFLPVVFTFTELKVPGDITCIPISPTGLSTRICTPGLASNKFPRWGVARALQTCSVDEPSSGLTICNFSGSFHEPGVDPGVWQMDEPKSEPLRTSDPALDWKWDASCDDSKEGNPEDPDRYPDDEADDISAPIYKRCILQALFQPPCTTTANHKYHNVNFSYLKPLSFQQAYYWLV